MSGFEGLKFSINIIARKTHAHLPEYPIFQILLWLLQKELSHLHLSLDLLALTEPKLNYIISSAMRMTIFISTNSTPW